jgi:uncharacterized damage-inducible protein DinB
VPVQINLDELLDYTAWQRAKWVEQLQRDGARLLEINAGPHGDGRFQAVGELVKHIFSAEKRYVERLSGRPLTDTDAIAVDDPEALIQFGQQSRRDLEDLIKSFPAQEWDVPREFKIMEHGIRATPRKIVAHVLIHEIRHWAQIATLLRLSGFAVEPHDFLFSPVMGERGRE